MVERGGGSGAQGIAGGGGGGGGDKYLLLLIFKLERLEFRRLFLPLCLRCSVQSEARVTQG